MNEDEIDRFLESQGIGTLSFGDYRGGYGIPMSFGFDSAGNRCIFQFAFGNDSRKATYIKEGKQVTLSTFEYSSVTDWASVVLRGPLRELPDEETTQAAGIFAAHAQIASLEVFQQPLEDLDLGWYALHIEEEHGRHTSHPSGGDAQ